MGALIKGRAASKALNLLMKRSMCYPVGADLYGFYIYYASASNRADGPTREAEPAPPDMEFPEWWHDLAQGDFAAFDKWIADVGAPSPDDDLPFAEIGSREVVPGEECLRQTAVPLPAAKLPRRVKKAEKKIGPNKVDDACFFKGRLDPQILEMLSAFKPKQFFLSDSFDGFDIPGALDLFSGGCGVAKQMIKRGCPWVLTFEWNRGAGENLLDEAVREKLRALLKLGAFKSLGAAPICSSFSVAVTPPVRSRRYPRGKPGISHTMRQKVREGNSHNDFMREMRDLCYDCNVRFWFENPDLSFWWWQKGWEAWSDASSPLVFRFSFCRFGTAWRKNTRIATDTDLAGCRMMCRCGDRKHIQLRGGHPTRKIPWTLVAQPYPRGLNVLIATAVCAACGWCDRSKLNIAGCAKVNSAVGEASNPGPAARRGWHNFSLEDQPLLSAQTLALESRLLQEFVRWCATTIVSSDVGELFDAVPEFLPYALRCYGDLSFQRGGVLSNFRHLVLSCQRWKPTSRAFMQPAWELVDRWEAQTPVNHRTPTPEILVQAMVTLAMNLGWYRWAGATLLGFYGAGRVGEILRCSREDLLLAEDLLEPASSVVFLRLRTFKSLNRQPAKIQHMKVSDPVVCRILGMIFKNLSYDQPLFNAPPQQFRRRWDMLLKMLGIPKDAGFTPGGLRGGAAVFHYRKGKSIQDLLWLMRLRSQTTLESYIQEVAALNSFAALSVPTRRRIVMMASAFPFLQCASGFTRG